MNANARIAALEKKVQALTMAIDAQNVTIAELGARIEAQKPAVTPNPAADYQPMFDRWPGNQR